MDKIERKNRNENIIPIESYEIVRVYSIKEIASFLGIGKTKTSELLAKKVLPVAKIGKQYFTSYKKIQDFLKDNIGNELDF